PADRPPGADSEELDHLPLLAAVQPFDRELQPRGAVDLFADRQWIVDHLPPALFLKADENPLLIRGRNSKPLDEDVTHPELPQERIPAGLDGLRFPLRSAAALLHRGAFR